MSSSKNSLFQIAKNRYFKKILMVVFTISLVPAILSQIFIYFLYNNYFEKEISKFNIQTLSQTVYSIEKLINEVEKISIKLLFDQKIQTLINNAGSNDVSTKSKVVQDLVSTKQTYEYIHSIVLLFENSKEVFSNEIGYNTFDDFKTRSFYKKYSEINATSWLGLYKSTDFIPTSYFQFDACPFYPQNVFTIVRKITSSTNGEKKKYSIFINIYESYMNSVLMNLNMDNNIIILDEEGNVVSHYDKQFLYKNMNNRGFVNNIFKSQASSGKMDFTENGKSFVSYYVKSSFNNWVYISINSADDYIHKLEFVRNAFIIIIVLLFLIISVINAIASYNLYNPVKKVLNALLIEKDMEHCDEFNIINKAIITKNSLEKLLNQNIDFIKDRIFQDIINGTLQKEEDIQSRLDEFSITFGHPLFLIAFIETDIKALKTQFPDEDQKIFFFSMRNLLEETFSTSSNIIIIEEALPNIIALINYNANNVDVEKNFLHVKNISKTHLNVDLTIGISRQFNNIICMKPAYDEASLSLSYKHIKGKNSIIFYEDIQNISFFRETIAHDEQKENELLNCISAHNQLASINILEQIFISLGNHSKTDFKCILFYLLHLLDIMIARLNSCGVDIYNVYNYKNLHMELLSLETIEDAKLFFVDIIENSINNSNMQSTPNLNQKYIEKAREFIDANYMKDISLADISREANLSPSYFSKLFKEAYKQNFIDYLTYARIEKAKELLICTDKKILEISMVVGYNNVNNFIKAFKKLENISPNNYRNSFKTP